MKIIDFLPSPADYYVTTNDDRIEQTYFDNPEEFRRELERKKVDIEFACSIDEIVEHERAHVETAKKLGYSAQYCLTSNGSCNEPSAVINNGKLREIPVDDLIAILDAPKGLRGENDENRINHLKLWKKFNQLAGGQAK